jgi:hypothetical protein
METGVDGNMHLAAGKVGQRVSGTRSAAAYSEAV